MPFGNLLLTTPLATTVGITPIVARKDAIRFRLTPWKWRRKPGRILTVLLGAQLFTLKGYETMKPNYLPFKLLETGERFRFASEETMPCSGMKRGPWEKISPRKYKHLDDGMECRVGSITAMVKHLPYPPAPDWRPDR